LLNQVQHRSLKLTNELEACPISFRKGVQWMYGVPFSVHCKERGV
jgi:hypothetical protein